MSGTSSKKWLRITIACPKKLTEAAADQMGVMSGVGVDVRPESPKGKQLITGFFALEGETEGELDQAETETLRSVTGEMEKLFAIYNQILHEPDVEIIDDQDWATSWKQYFTPMEIVAGLVIKPSWENYSPAAGQHVLEIDPGMAFGTGQHASTRLALSLLTSCFAKGDRAVPRRVLDIGTGTGILAMAAAIQGADQVMAIDNDPEAVATATRNVQVNQLDWNVGVSSRPLDELGGSYELICANIVHDVLVDMASAISRLAADNGLIILAGILTGDQELSIIQHYAKNSMRLVRSEHADEWAALLLEKSS